MMANTMHFNFNSPYPSIRVPVFARNVVSTSHPLAAQAAILTHLKASEDRWIAD